MVGCAGDCSRDLVGRFPSRAATPLPFNGTFPRSRTSSGVALSGSVPWSGSRSVAFTRSPQFPGFASPERLKPVPAFQRGALTGILFPRLARFTGFRDERQDGKGGKKRQSRPGKNPGQGRKKIGPIKARCADEHHKEDRADYPRQGAAVAEKPVGPASSRRTRSAVCLMGLGPSGRSCEDVGKLGRRNERVHSITRQQFQDATLARDGRQKRRAELLRSPLATVLRDKNTS